MFSCTSVILYTANDFPKGPVWIHQKTCDKQQIFRHMWLINWCHVSTTLVKLYTVHSTDFIVHSTGLNASENMQCLLTNNKLAVVEKKSTSVDNLAQFAENRIHWGVPEKNAHFETLFKTKESLDSKPILYSKNEFLLTVVLLDTSSSKYQNCCVFLWNTYFVKIVLRFALKLQGGYWIWDKVLNWSKNFGCLPLAEALNNMCAQSAVTPDLTLKYIYFFLFLFQFYFFWQ